MVAPSAVDVIGELRESGERVKVARNLHKKQLSIRHKNRVVAYVPVIKLAEVEFRVSQRRRERVLREKQKNLHAFAVGRIWNPSDEYDPSARLVEVTYNPYKCHKFYEKDSGAPVDRADAALIFDDGTILAYNPRGEEQ